MESRRQKGREMELEEVTKQIESLLQQLNVQDKQTRKKIIKLENRIEELERKRIEKGPLYYENVGHNVRMVSNGR